MAAELSLDLIQKLPKTDLHLHLDGSLRLETIIDLAEQQHVQLPTFDKAELFNLLYAGERCESLEDYLKAFDITLSVMQTKESLIRTAYELAADAHKENVQYLEVRYSPLLTCATAWAWRTSSRPFSRGCAPPSASSGSAMGSFCAESAR